MFPNRSLGERSHPCFHGGPPGGGKLRVGPPETPLRMSRCSLGCPMPPNTLGAQDAQRYPKDVMLLPASWVVDPINKSMDHGL